jgi:hypothetical protein
MTGGIRLLRIAGCRGIPIPDIKNQHTASSEPLSKSPKDQLTVSILREVIEDSAA